MRRVRFGARRSRCAAVVTLLAACASLRAEVPSAIAIKDARVVTVAGEDLPKATVLLRDGLIQDVGTGLAIPRDAWVIEGAGLTVYPGFIDGLSQWGLAPDSPHVAPAVRAQGPEDRPQTYSFERAADMLNPSDHRLEAARGAGFTAAATFPDRGIFEGLGAMIGLGGGNAREMVIAQPIGQQVTFRITRGPARSGYPASLMGNIAYVRQLYLDLDHYKQAKEMRRPEYDHALEGLAESPRVLLPAEEAQQIDRMLNFAPELKMVRCGGPAAPNRRPQPRRAGPDAGRGRSRRPRPRPRALPRRRFRGPILRGAARLHPLHRRVTGGAAGNPGVSAGPGSG